MEPAFPPSMLMFSHLPPVSSFARPALLCPGPELSLKKEPSSPPRRSPPGYLHIKQEGGPGALHEQLQREQRALHEEQRAREQQHREQQQRAQEQHQLSLQEQHYRLYSNGREQDDDNSIVQVTVGSHNTVQDLSLGKELFSRTERNYGADLKLSTSVKKVRRPNDSQEVKAKRKQSDSSKLSLLGDVEGVCLSPSQKPHICEHCSAAFRSSYHLRRHVLIHTGERPFQCSQCSMSFIQKYLLQRHEKIHSGEKPFCCDQCNMKFIQKYHMERHKRTHSGEKPYKCDTCQQYFSRTDRLLKHKRTCGDVMGKGGAGSSMEPGSSNMDSLSDSFELSQGNASSSGRRKSKSKNLSTENKEHKSGNKMNEPQMPINSNMQNYAVEIPVVSSSSDLVGMGVEETHTRVPKLLFKKVNRKNADKNELNLMSSMPDMVRQKHSSKLSSSLDLATSSGEETISLQSTSSKQGQNSSNYDDAMQFLKKRRYLQAANCNSAYAVNVGHMVSQQSVIQSAVANVMDNETPLALIDSSSLNAEIKTCQDKSGIPDEVLQSLLDHYSHKSEVHHEVPFAINEHHVDLPPSGEHAQLVQEENVCSDSPSAQSDKATMLYEYSKYLQQALERTSHNTSFPLGHSLQFVSLSSTLSNHSLFSDKQMYTTSPLECGFSQSIASVLPTTLPKSHFGMLVGAQPSFSLSTLESAHQQLTPSQELADQIESQKNLETSSNYQITSQELTNRKEQQKHLETASSNFHLHSPDLDNQMDHQKNVGPRATYQIENFAQAFGSQFKSGNRVPMAFNTNSDAEVDHRIRTSVADFSGYTNILSDVSESGNTRVKTSTSQSYR